MRYDLSLALPGRKGTQYVNLNAHIIKLSAYYLDQLILTVIGFGKCTDLVLDYVHPCPHANAGSNQRNYASCYKLRC